MTELKYNFTKKGNFIDHYFSLKGIIFNTKNMILLHEALNHSASKYKDGSFNISPISVTECNIEFRGFIGNTDFENIEEVTQYVMATLFKIHSFLR